MESPRMMQYMASLQVRPKAMMAAGDIQPVLRLAYRLSRTHSDDRVITLSIHSIAHPESKYCQRCPRPPVQGSDIRIDVGVAIFIRE